MERHLTPLFSASAASRRVGLLILCFAFVFLPRAAAYHNWAPRDIGVTGSAGYESGTGDALMVHAGGTDIFGTADGFRFLSELAKGDGSVVVRVDSITNTHAWAKAGVMIRASLAPNAANVAMFVTAANALVFQVRSTTGGTTTSTSGPWYRAPYWVKLTRVGNAFTGYASVDGIGWTQIGTQQVVMEGLFQVGIAGCSHTTSAQTVIGFSNLDSTFARTPPEAPSNLVASNVTSTTAHLEWRDNSDGEEAFRVYTESDDVRYSNRTMVAELAPNTTRYDLTGLSQNVGYNIWVTSIAGTWESNPATASFATPTNQPPPPPLHLGVRRSAPNTLQVFWDDNSGAGVTYEIERAAPGGAFARIGTVPDYVYMYDDPNLNPAIDYTYRVRATNAIGPSGYSPTVTDHAAGRPAVPTGLTVDGATDTTLHLRWTDNSNDETSFALERATGSGAFTAIAQLGANVTSYTDTGLTAATSYSYRLAAANANFSSAYSAVATGSTTGGTPPPPPPPPPSGWSSADIGTTGSTGSTSGTPPTLTMNAGGTDIYGTADGFRFVSRAESGDLTVIARVASITNSNVWAKAGVMIRSSLAPDAPNAAMLVTATNALVFQARTATAGATASTSGAWMRAPYWVKLTRSGNTFTGYASPDGSAWTQIGTQQIAMGAQVYVGFAGCSHTTAAQTVVSFDNAAVTASSTPPPPPPPPPPTTITWTRQSWNSASSSAEVGTSGTAVTIHTMSPDIWNRSDGGTFMYGSVSGNGRISARVDSLSFADPYSKAGLMFRGALDASAANVCVVVTAQRGIIFQARSGAGEVTTSVREVAGLQAPVRLSLARNGDVFEAGYSTDEGATWKSLGTVTVHLASASYRGPVGTSHTNSAQSNAAFSAIAF